MNRKRAIALVRVSTAAQAEREGLPAQREACERIAHAHGLQIVETVELEGVSGAVVVDDPRFRAFLRRVAHPDIEAVVLRHADRLMRPDRYSDYAALEALKRAGIALYTERGRRDLRSDRLLTMMESEIAHLERLAIAERTRGGRERRRRQGRRAEGLVGMPRGVAFDPSTGIWSYVWPEAEKIRQVFRLFLSGVHNLREIHRRTGIGAQSEPSSAILRVLRQPLYAGRYRADRRWIDGQAVPRAPEDVVELPVLDPPLVSPEEWQRAQELLATLRARRPIRRDPESQPGDYAGFLDCTECGSSVTLDHDSRGSAGYRCTRATGRRGCSARQLSVRLADPQLDRELERLLGDEATLRRLLEAAAEEGAARAGAPADLERRRADLENRRRRLLDGHEAGLYSTAEVSKRLARLNGEVALLAELMERSPAPIRPNPALVADLAEVFGSWADLGRESRRRLLSAYRIRVAISVPRRRVLHVHKVAIGVLDESRASRGLYNDKPPPTGDPRGESPEGDR